MKAAREAASIAEARNEGQRDARVNGETSEQVCFTVPSRV